MKAGRAPRRLQVALTGAFLTGAPVRVRLSEYSELQRKLGEALAGHISGGWDHHGIEWRGVPTYKYGGGGYSNRVPLVLVQREGTRLEARLAAMLRDRPEADRLWCDRLLRGWTWELRELRVQLYDFGVGVVVGAYEAVTPSWTAADAARNAIESLSRLRADPVSGVQSPVAAAYGELAYETVAVFRNVVAEHTDAVMLEPWLSPALSALRAPVDGAGSEWGRLLWLHPVHVLTGRPRASSRRLRALARPFRPRYSCAVDYPRGVFVPGIDSSAIVVRPDQLPGPEQEVPLELIKLHWAFYALFMEMDRGLLATLDDDKWQRPESLMALEDDAARMFRIYMRVREARARLDSALADVGGGQLGLWATLSDVTKLDELVVGVEGKVDALQRVAERRVQEAASTRARRTGSILSGLTALTVVTVAIALVGELLGTRTDSIGHLGLRVGAVLGALMIAVVLYREAHREIWRKRGRVGWAGSRGRRPSSSSAGSDADSATR